MINSFRHKGLEKFFRTGNRAGIQAKHAAKLRRQLARLDAVSRPYDMNIPGWKFHPLQGELDHHYSIWISGNWRMVFAFDGDDAVLVDYQDYH